jgi:hypothetical protein
MAKKKANAEGSKSPGPVKKTTTKVDPDVLRKANMVATFRGIDLFDYVHRILGPAVEADYREMIRLASKE